MVNETSWNVQGRIRRFRIQVFVAVCVTLGAAACATTNEVVATKPHADIGAFVIAGGVNTYYERAGNGEQAVILIHGLASSTYSYRNTIYPLAQYHSVYALDLKGFGASDKPQKGYALNDLRDQVLGFMDALGIPSAVLVGNSMGGTVAMRVALMHPERVDGLVLIDSAGFLHYEDTPRAVRRVLNRKVFVAFMMTHGPLRQPRDRLAIRAFLGRVYHNPEYVTREAVNAYYKPLRSKGGNNGVLARARATDWGDIAARIPEITVPTLVLWGREDRVLPVEHAERFREALPHATVRIYPKCGHHPQTECADRVNRDLLAFLKSLPRATM